MNHKAHPIAEVIARLVAWMVFAVLQIMVIGMSINALYPHGNGEDRSALVGKLWALCLPVLFAASVATVMWRHPPSWMSAIGGMYCLIGSIIVVLATGGLLFN